MQSPIKLARHEASDRAKFEMPDFDLSKIDLTRVEMPKIDLGKAVNDASIAIGLSKPRPSRWPVALGALIVVGLTGWVVMNSAMLRERLTQAKQRLTERVDEMRAERLDKETVAFTAAETRSIKEPNPALARDPMMSDPMTADYPAGLGTPTPELEAVDGRTAATLSR